MAYRYSPYIPDIDQWVRAFRERRENSNAGGGNPKYISIGTPKQLGESMSSVKLITPTESVVEQAKAELKRDEGPAELKSRGKKLLPKPGKSLSKGL